MNKKFILLSPKPRSHVRILIYRKVSIQTRKIFPSLHNGTYSTTKERASGKADRRMSRFSTVSFAKAPSSLCRVDNILIRVNTY